MSSSVVLSQLIQCQWDDIAIYMVMPAIGYKQFPKLKDKNQISTNLSYNGTQTKCYRQDSHVLYKLLYSAQLLLPHLSISLLTLFNYIPHLTFFLLTALNVHLREWSTRTTLQPTFIFFLKSRKVQRKKTYKRCTLASTETPWQVIYSNDNNNDNNNDTNGTNFNF